MVSIINRDKYLNVHYEGYDNTYFSIVQMQYFFLYLVCD